MLPLLLARRPGPFVCFEMRVFSRIWSLNGRPPPSTLDSIRVLGYLLPIGRYRISIFLAKAIRARGGVWGHRGVRERLVLSYSRKRYWAAFGHPRPSRTNSCSFFHLAEKTLFFFFFIIYSAASAPRDFCRAMLSNCKLN